MVSPFLDGLRKPSGVVTISGVAQISNLLYRGMAFRIAAIFISGFGDAEPCRVQLCNTAD
jgi:hypothetical protein